MPNYIKMVISEKELLNKISPLSFGKALQEVLSIYGYTAEDIETEFGISSRTIERYINLESRPKKQTLIRLLLGVSDSYTVSITILRKAGFSIWGNSWEDIGYSIILENVGSFGAGNANELIENINKLINKPAEKIKRI